jgi:hypothetical protein
MKTYSKLIALVAAFGLVGVSYAQDQVAADPGQITDNIKIRGFVDTSYNSIDDDGLHTAGTGGTVGTVIGDTDAIGVDEVEIDFLFSFGDNLSAEVHLDNTGGGNTSGDEIGVEQAHLTYDVGNGFSVQIGKYGSALGLEREDPAGLWTYSRAYGGNPDATVAGDISGSFNLGNVDGGAVYEGVALAYDGGGNYAIRLSFQDAEGNDIEIDSLDTELSISYTGIDNLTVVAGVQSGNGTDDGEVMTINAAYEAGKALVAFEYTEAEDAAAAGEDAEGYLLLVHYEVSEQLGLAFRYAEIDADSATEMGEWDAFTIAPNYSITDNLGAILEYTDGQYNGSVDLETLALELTLTF